MALRAAILKSLTMKGSSIAFSCFGVGLKYSLSSGTTHSKEPLVIIRKKTIYVKENLLFYIPLIIYVKESGSWL